MHARRRITKFAVISTVLLAFLLVGNRPAFSRDKYETIEAQAFGTGTQMGQNIGVTLNIYEFSTPADRVTLLQAFEKAQNQGLVNALQRMRAVGHVEITGTLGYDCAYIRMTPTPTLLRTVRSALGKPSSTLNRSPSISPPASLTSMIPTRARALEPSIPKRS
jgi:hypothetical protein